jgi:hypothetical protein
VLYQIADSASPPNKAEVEINRDLVTGEVSWILRTPGAFGSSVLAGRVNGATRIHRSLTDCSDVLFFVDMGGRSRKCFTIKNYYIGPTPFAHDDGYGKIYPNPGGTLRDGHMQWVKL